VTDFTRLTVIGTHRKAELVVPDDEALGSLLPELMALLDEPTGSVARPLTLVRATGEQLDAARSALEQRLVDGEQLRLVRADDAPPPPEVADVTDVVGDSWVERPGRWSTRWRESTGAVALGALACVALLASPDRSDRLTLALLVALLLTALLLGRAARRWGTIACTALAAGAGLPAALSLLSALGARPRWEVVVALTAALVWLCLGVGVGLGLRHRPVLPAALLGIVLGLLPLALAAAGLADVRAAALGGVAAAVVCGLLPWYALSSSGLTGLDDEVVAGRLGDRGRVLRTVEDAYASLSWSAVAVVLPLTGAAAVLLRSPGRWALALGLALVLLAVLRTRPFPLAVQQLPLWLGATAAAVVGVLARPGRGALELVLLAGLAVLGVVLVGLRPAPHVRARFRRLGNLLEALVVIALVPLLLGLFGVYTDLVGSRR